MKIRLALFLATLAIVTGLSASVASADGCACGGSYPVVYGKYGPVWNGSSYYCIYYYDGGPYSSPRYYQSEMWTSYPC